MLKRRREQDRRRSFTRRTVVLGAAQVGLFGVLLGRMYQLQVLEAARYADLADENRVSLRLIPPLRGTIVDRMGRPLAINQPTYRVFVVPEQVRSLQATLGDLDEIVPVGERDLQRVLRMARRQRPFMPITVMDDLTWDQVAQISLNLPDLPGVHTDHSHKRTYPAGALAAHIVGYTGAVTEEELNGDPVLALPEFRIGKTGIERTHDEELRGRAGRTEVEVNAYGRVKRELNRIDPRPGDTVSLTLDADIQRFASARLADQPGAVVVMDVHSGEIHAMAVAPSYDPNLFSKGISPEDWQALTSDKLRPLSDRAVGGLYAPGSTFKPVVALAALEAGVVDPQTKFFCSGVLELGEGRFHCWKHGGHGHIAMHEAIAQSCDVYFYEVARRLGIDRIAEMAHRLGLGVELGIDLPGERAGVVPSHAWKRAALGKPWQIGETLIAGIGQGYVLTTPLQLAVMLSRIVNGGRAVLPRIVRQVAQPGGAPLPAPAPAADRLGVNPASLALVRAAMAAVVEGPTGTARKARIPIREFAMGGKSGTSQVRRITAAERAHGLRPEKDIAWELRDHALFIGFAPIQAPRYACATIVEHGGGGSATAAPIVRDVLLEIQQRDQRGPAGPFAQRDVGGG